MSTPLPELRSKEIRICLVMYGGVSLAIYINGSAREFYDLVRGRGMWGVLKALADVDVTVDVVSGASAGGINGLFLSYALCREKEFSPLARLWREKAGFMDLLQSAADPEAASVLNSDYMEAELEKAFWEMDATSRDLDVAEIGRPAPPQELDCFLATTNYDGHCETVGDFRGSPLTLRSHRATLHLKHRQERKHPFGFEGAKPGTDDPSVDPDRFSLSKKVLAKIARATSAFPRRLRAGRAPRQGAPGAVHGARRLPRGRQERLVHRRRRAGQQAFHSNPAHDLPAPCRPARRPSPIFRGARSRGSKADPADGAEDAELSPDQSRSAFVPAGL